MRTTTTGAITGIGAFLPSRRVTSKELMQEAHTERLGVSSDFLERVSGIKERRFSSDSELPSTMAIEAARVAIADAQIDPLDIDVVLFCGIDRDYAEPATAHVVAASVGAKNAGNCFDISNACHGIMSGVSVANAYIQSGMAENILVCTGEKPSHVAMDVARQLRVAGNKRTFKKLIGALTLGDSGGAFILSKSDTDKAGFQSMNFSAKGQFADYCYIKYKQTGVEFQMLMDKICNLGVSMHKDMIEDTYTQLGWKPDSIGKIYCHQTGAKPHAEMANMAHQPIIKAPITYDMFGNLTSATIAVTMHLFRPARGERVLILSAGSGVTVGQAGLVYGS